MSYDGNGVFTRLYNWQVDRDNLVKISASRMDDEMDGFAQGLSEAFPHDGRRALTGNLPMGGNRITALSAGAAATPAIAFTGAATTGFYYAGGEFCIGIASAKVLGVSAAGVNVTGTLSATGTLAITGASTFTGAATFNSTVTLNGAVTVNAAMGVTGNATVGGTLGVTGTLTAAGDIAVGDDLTVAGTATVDALVTEFLNVVPGVPVSPQNGDIWVSTGGIYVRDGGVTYGPFSSTSVNIQEFDSSGTWTKPANPIITDIEGIGAGGGGGSGRRGAAGSARGGGAGGGGGGYLRKRFLSSALASSYTVTIGAGGTPGAGVTANDTNGNPGGSGGGTTVGSSPYVFRVYGGEGGRGGTTGTVAGGQGAGMLRDGDTANLALAPEGGEGGNGSHANGRPGIIYGGGGGGCGDPAGSGNGGGSALGGCGGGGGEGLNAANATGSRGHGGAPIQAEGGNTDTSADTYEGGYGGVTNGSNGGARGGGGGGGAAKLNGTTSGAGGTGGAGWVRFVTICGVL